MQNLQEPSSAPADYFGVGGRPIVLFLALVIGTVAVVTIIYGSIFGFDTWSNNMQQAGSLMLSNSGTPATQPSELAGPTAPAIIPAAATVGGSQLVCPNCGGVALPRWSAQGRPLCPNCGGAVNLSGVQANKAKLAAAPG
jgi:hypothetical protein